MFDVYKILICKPEGKKPHRRPRCRWEDNIKMNLREMGWETGFVWLRIGMSGRLLSTH
jgi:hypothetical protein